MSAERRGRRGGERRGDAPALSPPGLASDISTKPGIKAASRGTPARRVSGTAPGTLPRTTVSAGGWDHRVSLPLPRFRPLGDGSKELLWPRGFASVGFLRMGPIKARAGAGSFPTPSPPQAFCKLLLRRHRWEKKLPSFAPPPSPRQVSAEIKPIAQPVLPRGLFVLRHRPRCPAGTPRCAPANPTCLRPRDAVLTSVPLFFSSSPWDRDEQGAPCPLHPFIVPTGLDFPRATSRRGRAVSITTRSKPHGFLSVPPPSLCSRSHLGDRRRRVLGLSRRNGGGKKSFWG